MDVVAPLLDLQDPAHGDPLVITYPYNHPLPLGEVFAPAINAYLAANLPALMAPLVQPAADAAVATTAILKVGDLATGAIQTTRLLASLNNEFCTKAYADTIASGGGGTVITDTSLSGDGSAGNPLSVALIDGGVFLLVMTFTAISCFV